MVTIQKYVRAQSIEEAYELNQNARNRVIGGMMWVKTGDGLIGTAIDLCDLRLNTIEETDAEFRIGAMVTLRQLEMHPGLNDYSQNAVKDSVKDIVGVQFRNMATVGGSIWGRFGFSDVLTVFMVMDSYVELHHGGIIPLSEFATYKYDNDILVRLIVKKTPGKFIYSAMRAQRTDFPVLTCAVSKIDTTFKVSIGARPGRAILLEDEKHLLEAGITEETAKAFADYIKANVPTESNSRGSQEYRSHLANVLTYRNLMELGASL